MVVLSVSVGITFVLYSFPYAYSQINNTNNSNNNITIAEYFKDCFLQLKDSIIYGSDINNLIMMLCYETYKGERCIQSSTFKGTNIHYESKNR